MGRELASLGINLNFAPVLDIHTNPDNPVIGPRAFGSTPEAVIAAALPFIEAMQAEKILACGKHFPGHGDTNVDSHLGLPSQPLSLDGLRDPRAKAFRRRDQSGAFHDNDVAYSLSRDRPEYTGHALAAFLTGILREELGFGASPSPMISAWAR